MELDRPLVVAVVVKEKKKLNNGREDICKYFHTFFWGEKTSYFKIV